MANFVPQTFVLSTIKTEGGTISAIGSECGTLGCTGTYNAGTSVNLTATPATGFKLVNWSGDCNGTDSSVTVTMDKDKSCMANFVQQTFVLTVNKIGNGQVSDSGNYAAGVPVNLFAESDAGYQFVSWIPTPCASSFEMPAENLTCTATFKKVEEVSPCATANSSQYPYPSLDDDSCQAAQIAGPLDLTSLIIKSHPTAHFVGGMSIGSGNFLRAQTLGVKDFTDSKSTEVVIVKANITVAPKQVGKPADILVLVNYMPYDKMPSISPWYMLKERPSQSLIYYPFQETWNEKLSKDSPVAFSHVDNLPQTQEVKIFSGNLPYMVGTYLIYVGYHLTGNDQIIFGPKPIHFEILR